MSRESVSGAITGAVRYLFDDRDEAVTTVVIGGLLTFFSFLVVPQVVVLGYVVRVLRAVEDDERAPTFDRVGALLRDGVYAYVIWLAWMLVPLAVDVGLNGGSLAPGQATGWLLGWLFAPGVVALAAELGSQQPGFFEWYRSWEPYVVFALVLYVLPAALANFAARGTLRAGFFDDGLKRQVDWLLARLRSQSPSAADLLQRVADLVLGDESFSPVRHLRTRTYAVGWLGFAGFYLAAEALLRLFLVLPSVEGVEWVGLLYLLVALPAYFVLRIAGWVLVGSAWAAIRATAGAEPLADEGSEGESSVVEAANEEREQGPAAAETTTERPVSVVGLPLKTVLAGGLLVAFGFLVLPSVLVAGYLLRVLRVDEDSPVPSFGGVRALLADGLRAYGVWFVYAVVPLSLLSVPLLGRLDAASPLETLAVWAFVSGAGLPGGFPAVYLELVVAFAAVFALLALAAGAPAVAAVLVEVPLGLGVALVLASLYVVPAALVAVAREGRLRAGFAPRRLLTTLRRPAYATRWIGATGLSLVGWALVLGATLLPGHPRLAGRSLVEPVAGLDGVSLFALPTSVDALGFWAAFLCAGAVHFVVLVVACRLVGRGAVERDPEPILRVGEEGEIDGPVS
ncbi:hypothetical protein C2R22_16330 [Salinigranum rubrum]|uniref:DUF4013 domain-containing protein n=1 Tax=Salinigranum rubrum TaxID=755307 RepID=A0A2I8VM62_9EURY|nr:DUF4013 domain-containing protein [Salinigranum rubrum]AUV83016.1 hypothetical protein C2R22_16330 [Salinigranum rubrum]